MVFYEHFSIIFIPDKDTKVEADKECQLSNWSMKSTEAQIKANLKAKRYFIKQS